MKSRQKLFHPTQPLRMAANYRKSKAIASLNFPVSEEARSLTGQLLQTHDVGNRQDMGAALLDQLADDAGIDICNLKVSDTRQYHRRHGSRVVFRQYGYYRPQSRYPPSPRLPSGLRRAGIYIQNRTAVRGQPLAPRAFIETLLHEWIHHYDTVVLGLNSVHTSGFYARLKDLKMKLGIHPPSSDDPRVIG